MRVRRRNPTVRHVFYAWPFALTVLGHAMPAFGRAPRSADPRPDELAKQLHTLRERVDRFAASADLLDTLHFGWFDRPYARSALAVSVKTVRVLERELAARRRNRPAARDALLEEMLRWADRTLDDVHAAPPSSFRPHRLCVTLDDLTAGSTLPPHYAFVDEATATRASDRFGDLDLLAALGQRVYPRIINHAQDLARLAASAPRATDLGMLALGVGAGDVGSIEQDNVAQLRPITLVQMVGSDVPGIGADTLVGLLDPPEGESWAASAARNALGRAAHARFITVGWTRPAADQRLTAALHRAALWADALDGQALGLIRGWRDLRDGSTAPYESMYIHPERIDVVARTMLDILRIEVDWASLSPDPAVAVVVDTTAVDPSDGNRWAAWTEPIWQALLARQIAFDVVPASSITRMRRRYAVVHRLSPASAIDPNELTASIEREAAHNPAHQQLFTIHEGDESLAGRVRLWQGRTSGGQRCIAVINLADRSRNLRLRGESAFGPLGDALSDETVPHPRHELPLAAFQVRILSPP